LPEYLPTIVSKSPGDAQQSLLFFFSAWMFRIGLAFLTFEQVRPFFRIQISDYCFFLSIFSLLFRPSFLRLSSQQAKVLLGGFLVLLGSLVSLLNASSLGEAVGPLARFFVLFGLFGPLAVIHSSHIRKSVFFLLGGIFVNCVITLLQASILPGIADTLSINPTRPDISEIGRFQGLTSHPNIIGLSAGLAVLIGIGLLCFEENKRIRGRLTFVVIVCGTAALLSGSRAIFVSLVPGLAVLALFQKRRRQTIVRMLLALVVISGAINYLAPEVVSQFGERLDPSGSDVYSDYGRLWSAVYTVGEISQKPLIGWGIDHLDDAGLTEVPWTGEIVGAHNTFLKYWHGAGLLGAIGFLALFVVPGRQMWKWLKRNPSRSSAHALGLGLGCYVLLFIDSNLGPFDYNRFLYVPLFIFAGFTARLPVSLARRSAASRRRAEAINDGSPSPVPA
jgi:O-antigen ligase